MHATHYPLWYTQTESALLWLVLIMTCGKYCVVGPFSTGNSGLASPDLVKMGTQRDASACLPTA